MSWGDSVHAYLRGICHWASRKKMGQIIFGVQKETLRLQAGMTIFLLL